MGSQEYEAAVNIAAFFLLWLELLRNAGFEPWTLDFGLWTVRAATLNHHTLHSFGTLARNSRVASKEEIDGDLQSQTV